MYLLIDGQPLQTQSRTRGIGRYSSNLIAALREVRPEWRIEIVHSTHLPPLDPRLLTGCRLRTFEPPLFSDSDHADANERYYADWLTSLAPDALLMLNFFEGEAWVPRFTGPRPPLFGILYDLIPLLFPRQYLHRTLADYAMYAGRLRQMAAADGLLAISEASARDFRQLLAPPRPQVLAIGGAAEASFTPHSLLQMSGYRARLRHRFGLEREFILYVGGPDFRKNLNGALEAFALLPASERSRLYLVVACELSPQQRRPVEERAAELGISDSVKLTGYISDDELRALYQMCRVFFFPSLYEGLGLPVLEALQCGAPVVAADGSSVPEFAGDVSWLANPRSPRSLAEALGQALAEPRETRRAERVAHARTFTWQRSAELACRLLDAPVTPGPRKPRLAWVAPLPPMPCALAYHSAELLEHLAERYEIELVVAPNQPALDASLSQRHMLIRASEVAARHAAEPYDLFVYHIGNTQLCLFGLQLLHRFPGLVVLHDYPLGALVTAAIGADEWPVSLADELDTEAETELAELVRGGALSDREAGRAAVLNRRVVRTAEAVVVHSSWAWQRVREAVSVPVACVPVPVQLAALGSQSEERQRLGLALDAFVIATPELPETSSTTAMLLRAVAALPEALRQRARVVIIGPLSARQQYELAQDARQLGLDTAWCVTPALGLDELAAHARAADVWVQLTPPRADESVAHLQRAMAAGTACIVADRDSLTELPHNAVWKLRRPGQEIEDLAVAVQRLGDDVAFRRSLGAAAVEFSAGIPAEDVPARYAALIDLMIQQRQTRDALWVNFATEALRSCADPQAAQALIDRWAGLRAAGQQLLRARPRVRSAVATTPPARRTPAGLLRA
jgi:glycosyltransferase involved in cell wall biosynthesis